MPRRTFWNDQVLNIDVASGNSNVISLLSGLGDTTEFTLIRTIISVDVVPEDLVEANTGGIQRWAAGIGVTSEEAFSIGISAISNPQTATEHPARGWVWRSAGAVLKIQGVGFPYPMVREDIRSKRKIDRGDLFLAFSNEALEGTVFAIKLCGMVRCLLMLP